MENKVKLTIYKCQKCGYSLFAKKSYDDHVNAHVSEKKSNIKCMYCEYTADDIQTLQAHIYGEHKGDKILPCQTTNYSCDNCDFNTSFKGPFYSHIASCKNKRLKTAFNCNLCSYTTNANKDLKKHQRDHWSDSHHCPYCQHLSKNAIALQKHVYYGHYRQNEIEKKIHFTIEIHACPFCSFKTLYSRQLKTHNCSDNLKFKCSKCDYIALSDHALTIHVTQYHYSSRLECPYCDYVGTNATKGAQLQRHVFGNHRHQNEVEKKVKIRFRVFTCKGCSYSTYVRRGFDKHVCKSSLKMKCVKVEGSP
ncbi:unnamed protein product [Brassicogethes aeneus]|uniref:Protein hunchback n=1 Tax=Brassicogethes aeneus TaxID=1431903 RepID=A0A9P0AT45_BRAAE|nr:unnamed protein product [Brassicogethes aeneus]